MDEPRGEQAGLLIMRAWVTDQSADVLRVRIVQVIEGVEQPVNATTSIDEACGIVRGWLEQMLAPPPSTKRSVTPH